MTEPNLPAPAAASPASIINLLNQRLDEKASHIRRLEHSEVLLAARVNDLVEEVASQRATLDQLEAENRELRQRLDAPDLPELAAEDREDVTEEPALPH